MRTPSAAGNYALIGRLTINPGTGLPKDWTYRTIKSGEFAMNVANSGVNAFSYTLKAAAGILPEGVTSISYGPDASWSKSESGYTRAIFGETQPLGANTNLDSGLYLDAGYSYVSMGDWEWTVIDPSGASAGESGRLLFVSGDRTPASGIAVSGKATYDAHTLAMRSSSGAPGIPFTLTADFGQRTIATRIDQDFQNYGTDDDGPIQGIHVGGSAPFGNDGGFDIPLTGTVNYSYQNEPVPPPSESVTGDMNGAFFGPHAEQVGGSFSLHRAGEDPLYQDAFVGQQRPH